MGFAGSGYKELIAPASLLPVAMARNQIPIIRDVNLPGVSLLTMERPIGLRHNSPTVCRKYRPVRNRMLAPSLGIKLEPKAIKRNPEARNARPKDCLKGAATLIPFLANLTHMALIIGANMIMKPALKLWK